MHPDTPWTSCYGSSPAQITPTMKDEGFAGLARLLPGGGVSGRGELATQEGPDRLLGS